MGKKALRIISNKYLIVTVLMLVWLVFFDRFNLLRRYNDSSELNKLREEQEYYLKKTEEVKKSKEELLSDQEKLEKFARERYYMKKDNEDVYIVEQ